MDTKLLTFFNTADVKKHKRLTTVKNLLIGTAVLLVLTLPSWWPV